MIFNKQIKKNQIISKILELINKIIYFIGLFLTGSIILFLIYYNTSGLKHAHSPTQFIKAFNSYGIPQPVTINGKLLKDYNSQVIVSEQ